MKESANPQAKRNPTEHRVLRGILVSYASVRSKIMGDEGLELLPSNTGKTHDSRLSGPISGPIGLDCHDAIASLIARLEQRGFSESQVQAILETLHEVHWLVEK